jgi:hypothetical protein
MEYVSAEWVVSEEGFRTIRAIGDDGKEYIVPEADTDVPPWPDFLVKHGLRAIKGAPEPKKGKSNG